MAKAKFERLKVVLAKVKANSEPLREALAKVETNLASKKVRREVEAVEAKEKLAKPEKKVAERTVEAYKDSTKFSGQKAQAIAIFQISKEFYNDHHQFSKEAFMKASC